MSVSHGLVYARYRRKIFKIFLKEFYCESILAFVVRSGQSAAGMIVKQVAKEWRRDI
jgi:phosphomannomutase